MLAELSVVGEDALGDGTYLEDLTAMRAPVIAQSPDAILVAIEYTDLAIDGARCAPVAVGVEGDSQNQVLVAVLEIEVEVGPVVDWRRWD